MKLFVQIPCLNEEETIASVIREIPRHIEGVDEVKVIIINDGSSDKTTEVAYSAGADYVVPLPFNQGLARAFSTGINRCLELGADIIVNTDGDHQYAAKDIPMLIQPIMKGKADIVIGDRQTTKLAHFSYLKRKLQKLGSKTVSFLSDVKIPDATSGFRAYSREAALRLNVFSNFSYTLESIIQAGKNQIAVAHVPIQSNGPTRSSRLFSSLPIYLRRSTATMLRIYTLYEPLRTFFYIGGIIFFVGTMGVLRFLFFWFSGTGQGHVQSLVMSGVMLIIGFQVGMLGVIADLISVNRRLGEEILYRTKKQQMPPGDEGGTASGKSQERIAFSEEKVRKVV
jgi:glycosyltransferase involved in cell wall biosynthesis